MLSGIIIDAGQSSGSNINFETANEDAQKILGEAATVAEERIKDKFPDLPSAVPAAVEKTATKTQ